MSDTNSDPIIRLPVNRVNALDLIQELTDENFQLRGIMEKLDQSVDLIQELTDENIQLRGIMEKLDQSVDKMTNQIALQKELIQQLRDEIANLKGLKPKPRIPPSKLEGQNQKPDWHKRIGLPSNQVKREIAFFLFVNNPPKSESVLLSMDFVAAKITEAPALEKCALKISQLAKVVIKARSKAGQPRGKPRKKKKTVLQIHTRSEIHPMDIPGDAVFKGYNYYTVQEMSFQPTNIQYRLGRWQLPDGSYITGKLPKDVGGHYGPNLVAYILYQYHACRVTEHLLLDQLRTFGILISAGQLNNILIENKAAYIEEVAELMPIAARIEKQVQADDTGGRHHGANQYTTIIGNRWFSVFTTTDSKSRVNFLKLLQGGKEEYVINEDTLDYLKNVNVPSYLSGYISLSLGRKFTTEADWNQFLQERKLTVKIEIRFLTEAALYASVIQNGIPRDLGIHSDDAGQFNIFVHSLCWVHEERHYRKLIMTTPEARADLERVIHQIWTIYQALKEYKENPGEEAAMEITKQFDVIFQQKTSSPTLDHQLAKTYKKKEELLIVLARPETLLHNNSSETCARSAKIKLKISGGTRSKTGQKVRDVFLSLKQTCLKLNINFMSFLQDRVRGLYVIPRLSTLIAQKALENAKTPTIPHLFPLIHHHFYEHGLQIDTG